MSASDARLGSQPVPVQINDKLIDGDISRNTFQGGLVALLLWANATNVIVTENCVLDGGTQGPVFTHSGGIMVGAPNFFSPIEGSGFLIENNSYANNSWSFFGGAPASRDIWLTDNAEDNAVLESQGTVVVDEGTNNSVVLHGDGDPGFCNN